MIRRTTWIFLGVFALLVGLAFFLQRNQENQAAQATPTATLGNLFEVEESAIQGFRLQDDQGRLVAIQRDQAGSWEVTQPVTGTTDVSKAEMAITQLIDLAVVSVPNPAPSPEVIGLDTPAYTITVRLQEGRELEAHIGDLTPTGNGYYASLLDGGPRVVRKFSLDSLLNLLTNPPFLPTPTPTLEAVTPEATGEMSATATAPSP